MLEKKQVNALSKAYDAVYDLNSIFRFAFNDMQSELERYAKEKGYKFVLNQKSQKFVARRDA